MGQVYREVLRVGMGKYEVKKISKVVGELITPQEIIDGMKE